MVSCRIQKRLTSNRLRGGIRIRNVVLTGSLQSDSRKGRTSSRRPSDNCWSRNGTLAGNRRNCSNRPGQRTSLCNNSWSVDSSSDGAVGDLPRPLTSMRQSPADKQQPPESGVVASSLSSQFVKGMCSPFIPQTLRNRTNHLQMPCQRQRGSVVESTVSAQNLQASLSECRVRGERQMTSPGSRSSSTTR